MQVIGRIDRSIYRCVADDITTDEVVITDKQVEHVFEGHPQKEHQRVLQVLEKTITQPDYILEDVHSDHKLDTAIVMRAFPEESGGYRVILRLATSTDKKGMKNSVITAFFVSQKKWDKYLRNKTILYKRE